MMSSVQEETLSPQTRVLSKAECQVEMMRIEKENNYLMSEVGQLTRRFEAEQRIARCLSMSSVVPDMYMSRDGNDITAISNCYIALQMSHRLGCDPMAIMQNMYVIHGMPCFYAKFIIARINESGKFTLLRFEFNDDKYEKTSPEYGCRAVAYEKTDTEYKNPLYGEWITNAMVKAEGWDKNSKWRSPNMREQMFRYRSASFWQRIYAPELTMGIMSREEDEDIPYQEVKSSASSDSLSKLAEMAMIDSLKDVATQEE